MEPTRTTSGFRNPGLALSVGPLLRHPAILARECSRNCFPHAFRTTTLSSIEHPTYDNGQAGNLFATLFDAIANQTTVITPLAAVMPPARSVVDGLKHVKAYALILAPPFLEQIAKSPDMVVFIASNIETVTYADGDVSQWSGDALASKSSSLTSTAPLRQAAFPCFDHEENTLLRTGNIFTLIQRLELNSDLHCTDDPRPS